MQESTKEQILNATLELIAEKGFPNLTIREIADRAGANVAAVNYHFGSKEGLLGAVLQQEVACKVTALKAIRESSDIPRVKLRRFLKEHAENMRRHPGLYQSLFSRVLANAELPEESQPYIAATIDFLREILKALAPRNTPKEKIDFAGTQMMGALNYALLMYRGLAKSGLFDLEDSEMLRRYLDQLQEATLRGLNE